MKKRDEFLAFHVLMISNEISLKCVLYIWFCASIQGCRKLFGAGGGESRERGIQGAGGELCAAGANRGLWGRIMKKGILPCSVIIIFG